MEIVGGFMVMMSIISFFLAVVWLIMPFVVFAIKGKQDRTLEVLEAIEKRLAALEARIQPAGAEPSRSSGSPGNSAAPTGSPDAQQVENRVVQAEAADEKQGPDAEPAE